ncbi:MAG: UDP-N-acetylmuramoylalanyl-D-glutamyl-2,6-diaminopimelate--D-alanyl-D-alanine ligase [Alphaproteobacteria bacterium]|nr:UDP-N-acetylmuramoylalanyl-D-glutamyl-2,6-diaminopimelate--D-alanyl-D-alanine ligase [Alphaproteobacteria bacterium]
MIGKPLLWTAAEAAAAVGVRAGRGWRASGVSIDSRTAAQGDLFVAIKGERLDGHDYVGEALAAGAVAAIVDRVPPGLPEDKPLLVVEDTLAALAALGRTARARCQARVIAVTGSVGKTGTKEGIALALATQGKTHASAGNLNNEIGAPLSLARLPRDAAYAVFELGMNRPGEISRLSKMVRPDVAVITTVEPVHIEFFPSVEAIADAKGEIFDGMTRSGAAVLNIDNPQFERLAGIAFARGISRVLSFGSEETAYARLIDCSLHPTCSAVSAEIGGERLDYCVAMPGRHWVMNSLAILTAAKAAGADIAIAATSLSRLKPLKGRGERSQIDLPHGGAFVLIDESYNASPASVRAALSVLGGMKPGAGGRRIAVLGDMLELGAIASEAHVELAPDVAAAGVELVFACGPEMRRLFDALPAKLRAGHAANSAELIARVVGAVRAGDVVMVKGSLGTKMAPIVAALRQLADTSPKAANGN